MTTVAALLAGASVDAGLGVVAVVLIARATRGLAAPMRLAYRLLETGFGLGAVTLGATALWLEVDGVHRMPLIPFAIGLSAQAIAMLVAVLRLAVLADGSGTAIRRCVEGLVLASCGAYAGWTLGIEPMPLRYLDGRLTTVECIVGLLILTPSIIALSICTTVAWRARRQPLGSLATAIAAVIAASVLWLGAAGYRSVLLIGVAAGLYGCCLVRGVVRVRRFGLRSQPERLGPPAAGTLIAWVPVSIAIVACVIHLAIYGQADNTSIVIAIVIGAAIAARHTVTMREVRAYAAELGRGEALYKSLAHTDPLTELDNRRAFVQSLHEFVVGGPPSAVLAIDLDGFKNINDLRGHDVGDAVLVEVARRLRTNLRPHDIAARLGGDEFAVVLWLNPDEAAAAASRLRAVLGQPYDVCGSNVYLSASVGLAPSEPGIEVADLMRNADLALRFAKMRGKDRVEGYAEAFVQWLRRRITVEAELRGAIRRCEFSVLYQPVVELPSGTIVGAEALLRWHHPTLGSISPAEFIPIAEDSGLIDSIGRWVMGEACRQLSRWIVEGHTLWLAVNISVRELHRSDYIAQVTDFIRAHRIPANRLVLEVTEHAVAIDMDQLVATLAELKTAGVRIALDDFGAGYSSLGQLRRLPVDILKVDSSIVAPSSSPGEREAGPLADVIVRLGQRLGLDVIAEGVATAEQRQVVEDAGCVLVQGEMFGWPEPAEHLEARLATSRPRVPAPRPAEAGQPDTSPVKKPDV